MNEEREIMKRKELLLIGSDTMSPKYAREKAIRELKSEGRIN